MRISITLLLMLTVLFSAKAQRYHSDAFFNDLPQKNSLNPAWTPKDKKIIISLPGLHANNYHSGPVFDEIIVTDGDKQVIDLGAYGQYESPETLRLESAFRVSTVSIGLAHKEWYVQLGHEAFATTESLYSSDLMRLLWEGNGAFLGREMALDTDINQETYHSIHLSVARRVGLFSFGLKAKYISGLNHIDTSKDRLRFRTDEETLALDFQTDFEARSSGVLDYNTLDDVELNFSQDIFGNFLTRNSGWALDLGLEFRPMENLTLGLSAVDLGRIRWEENVQILTSQVNESYEGLVFDDLIDVDNFEFDVATDTLEEILDISVAEGAAYTTRLSSRYHLYGQWQPIEKWDVGLLLQYDNRTVEEDIDFSLWSNYVFFDILRAGLSWSGMNGTFDHLGAHFSLIAGPVSIYATSYDVQNLFSLRSAESFSGSLGMNVMF